MTPVIRFKYWLRTVWGNLMTYKQGCYDKKFDRLVVLTEEDKAYCSHCPTAVAIPNPLTFEPAGKSDLSGKGDSWSWSFE